MHLGWIANWLEERSTSAHKQRRTMICEFSAPTTFKTLRDERGSFLFVRYVHTYFIIRTISEVGDVENHTEQEYDVSKKSTIGTSVGQPKSYADAVRATGNRCHTIVG